MTGRKLLLVAGGGALVVLVAGLVGSWAGTVAKERGEKRIEWAMELGRYQGRLDIVEQLSQRIIDEGCPADDKVAFFELYEEYIDPNFPFGLYHRDAPLEKSAIRVADNNNHFLQSLSNSCLQSNRTELGQALIDELQALTDLHRKTLNLIHGLEATCAISDPPPELNPEELRNSFVATRDTTIKQGLVDIADSLAELQTRLNSSELTDDDRAALASLQNQFDRQIASQPDSDEIDRAFEVCLQKL